MGRLWDRYTGTMRPDGGVPAAPATELRDALLALTGTGVPFAVREASGEGAHLVAEWRVLEPPPVPARPGGRWSGPSRSGCGCCPRSARYGPWTSSGR